MKTKYNKIQAVNTHSETRTVMFNDEYYLVHFEIPYSQFQTEVRVMGFDINSEKQICEGYIDTKDFVNMLKEIKSRFIYQKIKGINFHLPGGIAKVQLSETDIPILDLATNEPDDEIMVELLKKLEAV